MRRVAQRLGLDRPAACSIIVAGTNGKGSSTTLLAAIYRAAGYRVGAYTSPHLLDYRERVAVDGEPASEAELVAAFEAIEQARAGIGLTYFEFGTLAALWVFRARAVQIQVLEVGLGGRLDAVNLIDAEAALITPIGLDHQDWLGPDREAIGREKAGVLRPAQIAVCADPDPPASILAQARALGCPLLRVDDFGSPALHGHWQWRARHWPLPALPGAHQRRNAAGVLTLVEALRPRLPLDDAAIAEGLRQLRLPGRFERRQHAGRQWVLDVAHNAEGAQVLADALAEAGLGTIRLVIGMLSDKPVEAVAQALAPQVAAWHYASLPGPRGLAAATLARRCARPGALHADVESALAAALAASAPGQTLLVCGSFLTVAAAQAWLAA